MKFTASELETARLSLRRDVGNKRGVAYLRVGKNEICLGARSGQVKVALPSLIGAVPVRIVWIDS